MTTPRILQFLATATVVVLVATACSNTDSAQDVGDVDRQAAEVEESTALQVGGSPKFPAEIPKNPIEAFNTFFEGLEFIDGVVGCFQPQGCFGDAGQLEINEKLDRISDQLTELRAEVAEGFAVTNLNIAESNYANAEREYNTKYGSLIPDAIRQLQRMSDPKASPAARKFAQRNFKGVTERLWRGSAEATMRDYLTTLAGSGRNLNQGGLLGAAWKLIASGERQAQGDAGAEDPLYLSASSVNLMVAIGTERLTEGAQLAGILAAYTVMLDPMEFQEEIEYRELLRTDLEVLWKNGVDGVPGAAAITASLPRPLPNQSGVFTNGFGPGRSQGLLVRNFGRVVDAENRTGPLINADSGYALTPAFDQWLAETKKAGSARRELAISRTAVDWAFDKNSQSLSTVVSPSTFMPYVPSELTPQLTTEYGSLQALHPRTDSGQVVTFAAAGTASGDQSQWQLDLERHYIHPSGRQDLCIGYSVRYENSQYSGVSGVGGKWNSSYNLIGPRFTNWEPFAFVQDGEQYLRLPRVTLRNCDKKEEMEWFLKGPIPQDGLPFWDIDSLIGLSSNNVQALDSGGYPRNLWKNLTVDDAEKMLAAIRSRGIKVDRLFQLYGKPQTNPDDRALPPILHPALWLGGDGKLENKVVVQSGSSLGQKDAEFNWKGVAIPVLDKGAGTFYYISTDGKVTGTPVAGDWRNAKPASADWISTAAIVAIDVDEPCTFLFALPRGGAFSCDYKSGIMSQLLAPSVAISAASPVFLTGEAIEPTSSPSPTGSVSPSPSESGSPSPSESGSPSPSESGSPSPSESGSPSPSESGSPSPSPTENADDDV